MELDELFKSGDPNDGNQLDYKKQLKKLLLAKIYNVQKESKAVDIKNDLDEIINKFNNEYNRDITNKDLDDVLEEIRQEIKGEAKTQGKHKTTWNDPVLKAIKEISKEEGLTKGMKSHGAGIMRALSDRAYTKDKAMLPPKLPKNDKSLGNNL